MYDIQKKGSAIKNFHVSLEDWIIHWYTLAGFFFPKSEHFLSIFIKGRGDLPRRSPKIISFSHVNSTNLNNDFKDNFMREKVNKMASKAKTLNICTRESNWKWIYGGLILSHEKGSHDAIPNLNQQWSN